MPTVRARVSNPTSSHSIPAAEGAAAQLILSTIDGKIGTLTFNHDEKLNCLSHLLMEQFMGGLEQLVKDGVNVIVLRAHRGVKVWSASHGINELPEPRRDPGRPR